MARLAAKPKSKFAPKHLNPQQEAFAQAIASGKGNRHAFIEAYEPDDKTSIASIDQMASRLRANPMVRVRIEEIRGPAVADAQITLQTHLAELASLRDGAKDEGQYGSAVSAEVSRGKAAGLYTEKVEHDVGPRLEEIVSGKRRVPNALSE